MTDATTKYTYGALTDRGDIKPINQDSILCRSRNDLGMECGLFLVADGMGGLNFGEYVSRFITLQFERWWEQDLPQMMLAGRTSSADIEELLEQEIWDINQAILCFRKQFQCKAGSTLALLLLIGSQYYVKNLGDSRVYLLRNGELSQLSLDQSLTAQLVRENKLTPEQARVSGQKSVLTMCIGMFDVPQSYSYTGTCENGDCYLICSDGVFNVLQDCDIAEILSNENLTAGERAELMREKIAPGQAGDNISIIVVSVQKQS